MSFKILLFYTLCLEMKDITGVRVSVIKTDIWNNLIHMTKLPHHVIYHFALSLQ